jgi:hypothetical protein
MVEDEDFIEIDGMRFMKPFVEKPIDAEVWCPDDVCRDGWVGREYAAW